MGDHDMKMLNTLVATTIDSANGFEDAARRARATSLARQLAELARDRWAVVDMLEKEVRALGGTPRQAGTAAGMAHRRWLDLKSSVMSSDRAVLQEVENGETYLRTKFETVLADKELSENVRRIITQAFDSVMRGHDQARTLNQTFATGLPEGRQVNWRAVGTGVAVAAAVGGAAYAVTRRAGSRRRQSQRQGIETAVPQPAQAGMGAAPAQASASARTGGSATSGTATAMPPTTRRGNGADANRLSASSTDERFNSGAAAGSSGTALGAEGGTTGGSFGATPGGTDLGRK